MKDIYDELIFMGDNILYAVKDGKAGLINGQGEVIADFIYDDVSYKTSKYYLEDDGIEFEFFNVTKDFYSMSLNGKMGVKDYNGNTILEFIYDRIKIWPIKDETYITAIKNDEYAVFNSKGAIIINFGIYDKISTIDKYIFSTVKNNKYGCLHIKDKLEIEPQYFACHDASSKLNLIIFENEKNKVGMVNMNNEVIADFKYDSIRPVKSNYIRVTLNNKCGIIDNNGNTVVDCLYDEDELEYYDDFVIIKKRIKTASSIVAIK